MSAKRLQKNHLPWRAGVLPAENFVANALLKKINRYSNKIKKLMQQSNRFDQQLTFRERKRKTIDDGQRKAETRTKIMLRGLVLKSRLTDLLAITPGDDLQLDPNNWEKAAVVLGALVDAYERLRLDTDQSLYQEWAII